MSKTLNFNNMKKQFLTITLADENNTTLFVGTPTKAIMNDLMLLQTSIKSIDNNIGDEALDDLYSVCARILSRNKANIKITKEYLEEIFDFEDIIVFFNAYVNFVSEISNSKN